jgi:hypothetical protein
MDNEPSNLRDTIDDAIVAGIPTLRVAPAKPQSEDGTFFCSFMLSVDATTHAVLHRVAKAHDRSIAAQVRRLVKSSLQQYFSEVEEEEVEQKVAA